ncbi:MAG: adenosylcobinamide-GDP ribazoletransferase [Dehalococcoidales bacterium]
MSGCYPHKKESNDILSFLAALQFLTSIPVSLKRELSSKQLGNAIALFPLVGLVIGGILAGLNWLLGFILPAPVINILLIVALVIITGAMHLDGLADTCDGIAGHKTVEERWKVMHDSRTGAFGVVGVVLVLLVQYVALNSVPADKMTAVLLFMPVISRWAMVFAIFAFPYARPTGLGKAYKAATGWQQFVIASIIALAIAGGLFPLFNVSGFSVTGGVLIITTAFAFYLKYKFAGLTGDTYGAINEVAEVMALIFVIIIFKVAPCLM